jgi:methionine sulfoxide reductase heme-binding subunit
MSTSSNTLVDLSWIKIPRIPLWLVYVVGFLPAAWFLYLGLTNQFGADPVKQLEREYGEWALRFLIATLLVTPLRQLFGINLMRYRRQLGLLAFGYVMFHLIVYNVLDQGLDLNLIVGDIFKRPFITVGMIAFLVLVPIAVTSNNQSIKRLGAMTWNRLHRWVYLAIALAAIHYVMLVKTWQLEPLIYAAIVAALLLYRLLRRKPALRQA